MSAIARSWFTLRRRAGGRWFTLRRQAGGRWAWLVLLTVWPLLALGALGGEALWRAELPQLSVLAVLTVALVWSVLRELGPAQPTRFAAALQELELGLLLMTGVYVLIAATGGLRSFLYPLAYAVVSFLMVIHRRRSVAALLLLGVAGLELAVGWRHPTTGRSALIAYHLTFIGFFAAGNLLVLTTLVRRLRGDHHRRVDAALDKMRQEARDFRLIASSLSPERRGRTRDEEELRMAFAAVEGIHEQLFHTLDLLRTSLGLRSAALLWCEEGEATPGRNTPQLCVKELATQSEYAVDQPRLAAAGMLTSLVADPSRELRLHSLAGRRRPPYYQGPEPVTDICAVALCDGSVLRGILCADRIDDRRFTDDEAALLRRAADHILRVIEHERVFTAVERSKYEQEQFYRASELLNEALTVDDVHEKTFAAVRAIAPYDLAVISKASADGLTHEVLAASAGERSDARWTSLASALGGLTFTGGNSLVAMAVKNRHFMPAGGEMLDSETVVFDEKTRLRRAKSVLVLPLTRGDQVLGSITLAAERPASYPAQAREMLRVISHHVGVSIQNARMYASMEERATTDGLTGLTNHRSFQERLASLHDLCDRTQGSYTLILTDIDHFKSINDTYGHPVGDQVLRRVAAMFTGRARKVDIVARYGGEEFVLVLPDTDGEGAEHFANKLREELEQQVMTSEHGSFKITMSMGIAEYGVDGANRLELIERADQALYFCKEHGRNCVRRWSQLGKLRSA